MNEYKHRQKVPWGAEALVEKNKNIIFSEDYIYWGSMNAPLPLKRPNASVLQLFFTEPRRGF